MRYECVAKIKCFNCECPIIKLVSYCCSDITEVDCRGCGFMGERPSAEIRKLKEGVPYANVTGGKVYYYISTGQESQVLPSDQTVEMEALMKEYGYILIGPQIGFAGRVQFINPPIQL